jgi:hypothetical protein
MSTLLPRRKSAMSLRQAEPFRGLALGVELDHHRGVAADDPGVVAGLDDVGVAGTELELRTVVVLHGDPAGVDDADVASLAALGPRYRLDAVRPPPPGLEREASYRGPIHVDDVHLRLVRRPRLIGRLEVA